MTSIFDQNGRSIACTVVHAQPNVVTQVKTMDSDGYDALQLAYGEAKVKNTPQSMQGHFEKAGTAPKRKLAEFRNCDLSKNLGDLVSMDEIFTEGEKVSAIGTSKGKGFQCARGQTREAQTQSHQAWRDHSAHGGFLGCGKDDSSQRSSAPRW